ncbi:TraR/DksA C4-type zinc finger protein [Paenibacillus sp. GCM10027626]|uniref:TraR/DksA C4-type zinc finger protein n=1 Tax=Paenibacillus sp. GCM10027626 TaxID=3273411 RepID=UPI0036254291
MNQNQLQQLRQQLEQERQLLLKRLAANDQFGTAQSEREQTGELSTADNHPADLATEMYERGKDQALMEHDELKLARIEEALTAMKEQRYGICLTCRQPIPLERLQAVPEAQYCIAHAPRQEVSDRRPIEEQIMERSLSRLDYDGGDRTDTWQVVAQWGNSDSPAMSENRDVDDYANISPGMDEPEYVEALETFLATDITGTVRTVIRNQAFYDYMDGPEGDRELEYDADSYPNDWSKM